MCVEFRTADLARRFFGTANDSSLRPMAGRPANTVDSMRCDAGKAATTNLSWNGRLYSKLSEPTPFCIHSSSMPCSQSLHWFPARLRDACTTSRAPFLYTSTLWANIDCLGRTQEDMHLAAVPEAGQTSGSSAAEQAVSEAMEAEMHTSAAAAGQCNLATVGFIALLLLLGHLNLPGTNRR